MNYVGIMNNFSYRIRQILEYNFIICDFIQEIIHPFVFLDISFKEFVSHKN